MEILIIHDHSLDTENITGRLLDIPGFGFHVTCIGHEESFFDTLKDRPAPDLILLGLRKPGKEGLELLYRLKQTLRPDLPAIILADQGNERTAVEFMKAGAFDYLLKKDMSRGTLLEEAVTSAFEKKQLEIELAEANLKIQEMAFTDGLTGLFNRHYFNESLKREYENSLRYNYPLSCIMADADSFKEINDRYGHLFGDDALCRIAEVIQSMVRKGDVAARYGGDEFVILLPHTDLGGAVILADRIREKLSSETIGNRNKKTVYLTASFGISSLMAGSLFSMEDLINQADDALYQAKERGKNQTVAWKENIDDSNEEERHVSIQLEYYKKSLERIQLQVKAAYLDLTESLVKAIESRDPLVVDFSKKVMALSVSTAMKMELPNEAIQNIKNAALLHDIGMIGIPDRILLKKAPLTPKEVERIRTHPSIGVEMLQHVSFLDRERQMIMSHHEWFNGTGYPQGLCGKRIPLGARIIAVADAYVAMCHDKTHRKGMDDRKALKELNQQKGEQFDPEVVDAFMEVLEGFAVARTTP